MNQQSEPDLQQPTVAATQHCMSDEPVEANNNLLDQTQTRGNLPEQAGDDGIGAGNTRNAASITLDSWGYRHASRPQFAVRNLSLHIRPGERVLLLGASGIGKSTILQGLAGLIGVRSDENEDSGYDADEGLCEGHIRIGSLPVGKARGKVGLVLQDPDAQVVFERVGDNVAFGPENMGVPFDEIWDRVDESLASVGLQGLDLQRTAVHLSGGQTQRLALAGVLAMRPEVLLLDEPTANLDPDGVSQVVEAVHNTVAKEGCTMVLVEHRVEPWLNDIDRVIVLGRDSSTGLAAPAQDEEHNSSQYAVQKKVQESAHDASQVVSVRRSHNDSQGLPSSCAEVTAVQDSAHVVIDGDPHTVFTTYARQLEQLGVWVPKQYLAKQNSTINEAESTSSSTTTPMVSCDVHTQHHTSSEDAKACAILSTDHLSIGRNGQSIAEDINVALTDHEIVALIGPNGAGKTTLALSLAGLLEPVGGHVHTANELAAGAHGDEPFNWHSIELSQRIAYVFQNPEHQFVRSTVLDEVMLSQLQQGVNQDKARVRAEELLEQFHLSDYMFMNPYTLSGGEKRRLSVISALAASPKVLILDEPTFGQDRNTWQQMVEVIRQLQANDVSIIIVTHDEALVEALHARTIVFSQTADQQSQSAKQDRQEQRSEANQPIADDQADVQLGDQEDDNSQAMSECLSPTRSTSNIITVSHIAQRYEEPKKLSRSALIARMNPVMRILAGFAISIPLIITLDVVSSGIALAVGMMLLVASGISLPKLIRLTFPVWIGAPGSALAVLLYGKIGGEIWWSWGFITVSERSAYLAIATLLRVLAVGVPSIALVIGINATDLADGLSQKVHLPDRFVYGALAGIRLFTVLQDDWKALTLSRRSRGLGDKSPVRSFLPQTFALLVLSIRRSTLLATAMEAKGFGGTTSRSYARISKITRLDWAVVIVSALVPITAIIVAVIVGKFNFFGG